MPTYDYLCKACEHTFEEFQMMSANPLRKCPECGQLKLQRLIGTGAGVIFKGSGFYETDYRSDSYKQAAKAESDSAKPEKTDKKDSAKKEAAAKTDTSSTKSGEIKTSSKNGNAAKTKSGE